ncbi:MAG: recombinase family protein [Ruminococcus sp.]|nr:recombinase family protein [Ruminococcus sp.]MCM1480216.1 recombinase family protein [Muribaculaceae bacterium]
MASIAQEESHKISERTKWGLRRKMEDGVVLGRGRVYGYELVDGKMVIVENEAEVVKEIFHGFLYDGKGSTKIAQELNARNISTLRGRLWGTQTIIRMLRNEKYVGDLTQWKICCTNYLTGKTETNKGNHPDMPLITIKNHHEPIISREVWDGVQAELERRGQKTKEGKRHSNSYWHSGKVFCGVCGKPYYLTGGTKLYSRGLVCSNRTKFGKNVKTDSNGDNAGCPNKSINQHVLDACMKQVIECVQSSREEIKKSLLEDIRRSQKAAQKKDIEPLKAEINSFVNKKIKAVDLMLEGLISKDDLRKQTDFYNSEIERLTREISDSININSSNDKQIKSIQTFIDKVNATENIDKENTDIYGELTEKIIINDNCSVDIYLSCLPFAFHVAYHVEKYTRIGKYDIFIDSCEVAA